MKVKNLFSLGITVLGILLFIVSCSTAPESAPPKDSTPPVLTLLYPTNGQLVGGVYSLFGTANDPESGVAGVYVALGSGIFKQADLDNVVWSSNITLPVYGPVTNYVYAVNGDGVSTLTQSVVVERVSIPGIAISSPENYLSTKDPNLTISGTAVIDAPYSITAVQVKLNNGSWLAAVGTESWSKDVVLQEGLNLISVRAIGSSGKTNSIDNWQVTLDSTLPDVFIQTPADGTYTNNANVTVSGIASNQAPFTISKVQVKLNLGAWVDAVGTATWSKALTLVEGTNSVSVRAISTANKTNSLDDWKLYLDTTKPVLTVVAPAGNIAIVSNHYTLSGVSSDLTGIEGIYVSVNAGAFKKLSGTTAWSTNLVSISWFSTNTIKIFAKDAWGLYSLTNTKMIYMRNKLIQTGYYMANSYAGYSVAVSDNGNTALLGSYAYATSYGACFVHKLSATAWGLTRVMSSDGGAGGDWFADALAITPDGTNFISGARQDDIGANADQGSAYIYKWNGSSWDQTKLTSSDGGVNDMFGQSVDISSNGNTIVVGAFGDDIGANDAQGSVYVYKWSGSWVQTKIPSDPDGAADDQLGYSVAISGDGNTIAAGAVNDDVSGKANQGSLHVYRWNGSSWVMTKITASDGLAGDQLGVSVDTSYDGNAVIVGAWNDDSGTGSAYIFKWNGVSWVQTKITASDASAGDQFGCSVSISGNGNVVLVGARWDDIVANNEQGSVYVYKWSGSWVQTKYLAPDGAVGDEFGTSVALNKKGTIAIVGAIKDDTSGYTDMGSAWVFSID
ncbi:MAG: hypothetical protein A2Y33_02925 [Spirochaetes bacterium GWF1_51_8]|nr:MAG: hypothetical protein A2Y33_02925 [Spirochaetes bacterium GWF1_51_8]